MDWGLFAIFMASCAAAGTTGAAFKPGDWYEGLRKPVWTPPKWAFPVVWSTLYLLMSYSAMRVAMLPDTGIALAFWGLQIALNTLWTPIFFGLRRMREGFFVILALWAAVAATAGAFAQADLLAGVLFLPYLLWVSVAAALNLSVWRLNPDHRPLG